MLSFVCVFLACAILPSPKSHSRESAFLALHCFPLKPAQSEKFPDKQEIDYAGNGRVSVSNATEAELRRPEQVSCFSREQEQNTKLN